MRIVLAVIIFTVIKLKITFENKRLKWIDEKEKVLNGKRKRFWTMMKGLKDERIVVKVNHYSFHPLILSSWSKTCT